MLLYGSGGLQGDSTSGEMHAGALSLPPPVLPEPLWLRRTFERNQGTLLVDVL